jgi:hypothetical protein
MNPKLWMTYSNATKVSGPHVSEYLCFFTPCHITEWLGYPLADAVLALVSQFGNNVNCIFEDDTKSLSNASFQSITYYWSYIAAR